MKWWVLALVACKGGGGTPLSEADADTDADSDTDTDTDTDTDADTDTDTDVPDGVRIAGVLHYEAPLPTCPNQCYLDYTNAVEFPVRHHRIVLRDTAGNPIEERTTNDQGHFEFYYDGAGVQGSLYVYADATLPGGKAQIRVEDNTDGLLWGSGLGNVDLTIPVDLDLLIEDGWNGSNYAHRASGPFAISNSVLEISEAYLDHDPNYRLDPLIFNWSPDNRPEDGDESLGLIGTSFYRDSEGAVYLLGAADVDTDEFDKHVVFHEWMHFFQDRESRSDSSGGSHPFGAYLDPRVAAAEGMATAVSALLYADLPYTDTRGEDQVGGFDDDLEAPTSFAGFWSQETVERGLYDLYDTNDEPGVDSVSLPMSDFWQRMVEDERDADAYTTFFSFFDAVKGAHPAQSAAIDAISTSNDVDPVQDAFGSGETHNAGWAANLPVHADLDGGPVTVTLDGDVNSNRLGADRFARFTGAGGAMTVEATSDEDVDLFVYQGADFIGSERHFCNNPPCTESLEFTSVGGARYRVEIRGYGDSTNYTALVELP